jgi:uncharacterized protein YdaU (DUF1376 family)
VQLEPDAFLSDVEFQTMSAEERGCYFTIILYLYRNNGKLDKSFDPAVLGNLCNCTNFETVWEKISKKFVNKKNVLSHKRVTKEIKRVRKRMQVASTSGLKGAQKRWGTHSNPIGVPIAKSKGKSEVKEEREDIIKTLNSPLDFTADGSFDFKKLFTDTFKPINKFERNTLNKLATDYGDKHKGLKHVGGYMIGKIEDLKLMCREQNKSRTDFIKIFVSQVKKEMK